jgi:hypothetical protein
MDQRGVRERRTAGAGADRSCGVSAVLGGRSARHRAGPAAARAPHGGDQLDSRPASRWVLTPL